MTVVAQFRIPAQKLQDRDQFLSLRDRRESWFEMFGRALLMEFGTFAQIFTLFGFGAAVAVFLYGFNFASPQLATTAYVVAGTLAIAVIGHTVAALAMSSRKARAEDALYSRVSDPTDTAEQLSSWLQSNYGLVISKDSEYLATQMIQGFLFAKTPLRLEVSQGSTVEARLVEVEDGVYELHKSKV